MIFEVGLFVAILVMIVLFSNLSGVDSKDYSLLSMVFGFSAFVGITCFFLALTYFSSKPNDLIWFLTFFVIVVLLPMCLCSTAISAVNVSNLRQAVATAGA
jgi:hypothetical protein